MVDGGDGGPVNTDDGFMMVMMLTTIMISTIMTLQCRTPMNDKKSKAGPGWISFLTIMGEFYTKFSITTPSFLTFL